jgi:iron complex transport system permease protein
MLALKKEIGLAFAITSAICIALGGGVPLQLSLLTETSSPDYRIFFELRVPRALFVFFAGASLACIGAIYQILFHNPLAEPYILGVSSGATLAMAIAEMGLGILAPSFASQCWGMGGASIVTLAFLALSAGNRRADQERLILFGMGVNFVLSSLLFLLLSYYSQTLGGGSIRWLFGQIPWVTQSEAVIFALVSSAFLLLLWVGARALDALAFGDEVARSLGISAKKMQVFYLASTSLLLAWLVSFTGAIGFLGLVAPHLAKRLFYPDSTRKILVLSSLIGGGFLLLSDGLSRGILPPLEFPIGILTTLLGGPLFLVLLWKK